MTIRTTVISPPSSRLSLAIASHISTNPKRALKATTTKRSPGNDHSGLFNEVMIGDDLNMVEDNKRLGEIQSAKAVQRDQAQKRQKFERRPRYTIGYPLPTETSGTSTIRLSTSEQGVGRDDFGLAWPLIYPGLSANCDF